MAAVTHSSSGSADHITLEADSLPQAVASTTTRTATTALQGGAATATEAVSAAANTRPDSVSTAITAATTTWAADGEAYFGAVSGGGAKHATANTVTTTELTTQDAEAAGKIGSAPVLSV